MDLSPFYFATKLAAYVLWLFVGLRLLRPVEASFLRALALGTLRLLMGFGFGLVIWLGGSLVYEKVGSSVVAYLSVYVPVRWIEWGIFEVALDRQSRSLKGFLLSSSTRGVGWRVGGIVISCLADIPVIVSLGGNLAVGRFMC